LVATAFLALGLAVGDYIALRNQVAYIQAEQVAERSRLHQHDSANPGNGPNTKDSGNFSPSKKEEPKWTDIAITAFTFAIAIFTIGLFWDGREKGRKELRAYVGVPDAKLIRIGENNIFQIQVTITNSGHTPAKDVQKWMNWAIEDKGSDPTFEEKPFDSAKRPIAPDSQWLLRNTIHDWNDETITAISTYEKSVFVWGTIIYEDIYGNNHFTQFRVRTDATMWGALERIIQSPGGGPEQKMRIPIISGWELQPEADGNDLD
jgi:hypothetical protein